MEKAVFKARSHRESEEADREYYASLSPQERVNVLLELVAQAQTHEAGQEFAQVYRVVKLHER